MECMWRSLIPHNGPTEMITYRESIEGISPDQLRGFFVDWRDPPSPETHLTILRGSNKVVLAVDGERVVGFVTVLSDGVLHAYISLLEVLPEYRGRGIGSELMRRVLGAMSRLYAIDVLCDPQLQPFYQRLGFRPGTGMMMRNCEHQAGTR
jgi:ribosomal protein S18 acetylase RimI-like enzyme